MRCGRCGEKKKVRYRVFSDIIDVKVCANCAAEARSLHLGLELLDAKKNGRADDSMRKAS
jgi:hypothetical protein